MKQHLPKLNYSLLSYFLAALVGVLLFFLDADNRYQYTLLAVSFIFILTASCFNALTDKSYRTIIWPFVLNLFFVFGFFLANGGSDNASLFGSNQTPLAFFFISMGFNSHWYMLLKSINVTDLDFLLLNAGLSLVIPSFGYLTGYIYALKSKPNAVNKITDSK